MQQQRTRLVTRSRARTSRDSEPFDWPRVADTVTGRGQREQDGGKVLGSASEGRKGGGNAGAMARAVAPMWAHRHAAGYAAGYVCGPTDTHGRIPPTHPHPATTDGVTAACWPTRIESESALLQAEHCGSPSPPPFLPSRHLVGAAPVGPEDQEPAV